MSTVRVLFVDDSEDDVLFAERALRRAGVDLVCRRVWNEASLREALSDWSPDIIVCDVYVPGLDARRIFDLAHQGLPSVPFLLRSGGVRGRIAAEVLNRGGAGYVEKGDDGAFVERVRALLTDKADPPPLRQSRAGLPRPDIP